MNIDNIIEKYGLERVNRMIANTGTLEERLKDKATIDSDFELRSSIAELKYKIYEQQETQSLPTTISERNRGAELDFNDFVEELDDKWLAIADSVLQELKSPPKPQNPFLIIWVNTNIFLRSKRGRRYAASFIGFLMIVGLGWSGYNGYQFSNAGGGLSETVGLRMAEGTQGDTPIVTNEASRKDTICNCGAAQLWQMYAEKVEANRDFDGFRKDLEKADANCKQFWTGWLLIEEDKSKEAAATFDSLWKTLTPDGELYQRTSMGLMKALWASGQRERLQEVTASILTQKQTTTDAYKWAKKYQSLSKQYWFRFGK